MRLITGVVLLLVLVVFALSNTQSVRVGLWPIDVFLALPLSIAILTAMAVAFFAGGLIVWLGALGQSRRARQAEHLVRLLQAQLAERRPAAPAQP